jgi:hypothetical protein
MKRTLVRTWTTKLLDASLVELSKGEYALVIVMLAKKDIFGNWTKWHMCGDYHLVNNLMRLDKYAMPLSKKIFDALGQAKVFSTLNFEV